MSRCIVRGDLENRIKENQQWRFADRTSSSSFRANQLRLLLATLAYSLVNLWRHHTLQKTKFARAQCGTIRSKLLKLGGSIRWNTRKVYFSLSSVYPYQDLGLTVYKRLQKLQLVRLGAVF